MAPTLEGGGGGDVGCRWRELGRELGRGAGWEIRTGFGRGLVRVFGSAAGVGGVTGGGLGFHLVSRADRMRR